MTDCHACGEQMHHDVYGHPVHNGPCPGAPSQHPCECPWCGTTYPRAQSLQQHHRACTRDNPTPPRRSRDQHECERCHVRHTPRCGQTMWPIQPLVDAVGTTRIYDVLDLERTQLRRLEVCGIPTYQADRWALAFRLHPSQVWGDDWWRDALPGWLELGGDDGSRRIWEWNENEQTFGSTDNNKEKAA